MFQMNQLNSFVRPDELRHGFPPFQTTGIDDDILLAMRLDEDTPTVLCRSTLGLSE